MAEEKEITFDRAGLYLDLIDGASDGFLHMTHSPHYLEDYPEIKELREKAKLEEKENGVEEEIKTLSQEQLAEFVKDYSRKLTYCTTKLEEIVFSEKVRGGNLAGFGLIKDILKLIKIPALPLSYNNSEENNFAEKYCLEIKQFVKDYYNYAKELAK